MSDQRRFGPGALEMFSIVVAIVLGFAVTSWDETRRERAKARDAVDRISMELAANEEAMRSLPAYYRQVVAEIDSLLAARGDGPFSPRAVPSWAGVRPPTLRTSAYRVAETTGALGQLDFALADELTFVYTNLDVVEVTSRSGIEALVSGSMRDLSDMRMFLFLMQEQVDNALAIIDGVDLPPEP